MKFVIFLVDLPQKDGIKQPHGHAQLIWPMQYTWLTKCLGSTFYIIMPPTLKKLEGHIAFGLSVCVCVCVCVRLLTFEW